MSAVNAPAAPVVKLPKAVQMQMERVNAIQKEQVEKKFKEATPTGTQTVTEEPVQSVSQTTPTEPAPIVEVVPTKSDAELAQYWEHRFKTSRGMDEAEKNRLKNDNSILKAEAVDLKSRLNGFEARFKELEGNLRTAERQVPTKVDLKKYLTEQQIDAYGPEVLEAVVRTATHAGEEAVERRLSEEIERQVAPVRQKLDESERQNRVNKEANFWDTLESKTPDWAIINDTPKWHEWLSQKDPVSGFVRQELLSRFQTTFDSERVVAMFDAFKQSSPAPRLPETQQSRVVPDPVGQTAIVTGSIPETAFITKADISRFYRDCALHRYDHKPQEREAMERKIREARIAGTVR